MAGADDGRTVSAIARLANQLRREFGQRMRDEAWAREAGMRAPAYGILQILRARRPVTQRALATMVGIDPGDLVAIIDMLERAGFVTRRRDEADRRRHNLVLTPAGATATARMDEIAAAVTAVVLAPLTRRERAVLERLLAKAAFSDVERAPERARKP
jgi:DNA-binding MarR family transcriptional regulator